MTFSLPPSPTERKRRADRRRAILLLGGAIAAVTIVGIAALWASLQWVERDPETLCPKDDGPTAQVVVLLDVTDPLNEVQREFVSRSFSEIQETLPEDAELALYALRAPAAPQLSPEVHLCNPGSGRGKSPWWQNPEKLQRRWEEGFRAPLARLFDEALDTVSAQSSPIMEQIQAASVGAFDHRVADRRLIVVSDMLQNSGALNMYRESLDFERFHASTAFEAVRANLPGVEVQILYVLRANSPHLKHKRSHIRFWEQYFESSGGRIESVVTVPGLEGKRGE